jgi:anti-sigma regulatory factor (Ser/Thr protein kinase)
LSKTETKSSRQNGKGPEGTLQMALDKGLAGVAEAAENVEKFLQGMGVPTQEIMAMRLAFIEAGNNAVQYATAGSLPPTVTISLEAGQVTIIVTDHTPGFQMPSQPTLPDDDTERGRGLYLLHATMDRVEYHPGEHGNRLIMWRRYKA